MSLLKDVERFDPNAARVLEEADLRSNHDLHSLTREDLHELFPGGKNFKLRREIFDKIHKKKPVAALLRELKGFIPSENVRAALTNNGVLVDYLHILKDMKTHMSEVQNILCAHVDLLEEFSKDQLNHESDKGPLLGACSSDTSGPVAIQNDQSGDPQGGRGSPFTMVPYPVLNEDTFVPLTIKEAQTHNSKGGRVERLSSTYLKYRIVVGGKTLGTHRKLMEKVIDQSMDKVQFVESDEDPQITVVFCPVISRIGSDVEDALSDVKADEPVILVLMHHTFQPKHTTSMVTWSCKANIVLHVNVFYHETRCRILTCNQNDAAVNEIRKKLLEYRVPKIRAASEMRNAIDVGGDKWDCFYSLNWWQ